MPRLSRIITTVLPLVAVAIGGSLLGQGTALASPIPVACLQWQRPVTRIAQYWDGLAAPVALYGAIIRQESACRPAARSPAGAQGLAQFMPGTVRHVGQLHPHMRHWDPFDPVQSLHALVLYYRWLGERVAPLDPADACQDAAFRLSAYNGGIGWTRRDARRAAAAGADPHRWFGQVERFTARSARARRENRHYVRVILLRWQPAFQAAGWGGPWLCEGVA